MQTLKSINVESLNKKYDNKIIIKNDNYMKVWDMNNYHYSGEYKNGQFNGNGTIKYINHPVLKSYCGEFINGVKEGYGIQIYQNDDIYYGNFLNNKRHGNGKLVNNVGLLKCNGNWSNDKFQDKIIGFDYDDKGNKIYFGCIENDKYTVIECKNCKKYIYFKKINI